MRTRFPVPPGPVSVPVNVQWNFLPSQSRETPSIATSKNPLLHICDLYDTALCLRVLWILHHRHVQFLRIFAECDVCCAIARGDLNTCRSLPLGDSFKILPPNRFCDESSIVDLPEARK